MANTFMTDKAAQMRVASVALSVLARQLVLPATVFRNAESEFSGRTGDTVTIRKPATLTSRTYASRDAAIEIDDLDETGVPVTIDNNLYSAVAVTDEQMEFEVDDFASQVVAPQLRAVGEGAENILAAEFNGLTSDLECKFGATDIIDIIIDARKMLSENNVPNANRYLAVSTDIEAALLKTELLQRVDASGTDSALRQAMIARLFGFDILVSNALDAGTAVAYSRDAFAFCLRAPRVPQGAAAGSSQSYQGLALRWIMDYESDYLQDRSIVSTLVGATILDEDRCVKITTGTAS